MATSNNERLYDRRAKRSYFRLRRLKADSVSSSDGADSKQPPPPTGSRTIRCGRIALLQFLLRRH
jgi:hypothetical protein